jgi:hypothetical protein
MVSVNISFFMATGSEIRWGQTRVFLKDGAALKVVLHSGILVCLLVSAGISAFASVIARPLYHGVGLMLRDMMFSLEYLIYLTRYHLRLASGITGKNNFQPQKPGSQDIEQGIASPKTSLFKLPSLVAASALLNLAFLPLLRATRPRESMYRYLSLTLPLSPFLDLNQGGAIHSSSLTGNYTYLNTCSSFTAPPRLEWLPAEEIPGFRDWYSSSTELHHDPAEDCMHISNLAEDLLKPLRLSMLKNEIKVKHVVLVAMESTRKDVFPLKKDSVVWNRVAESYPNNQLPPDVEYNLNSLTKTAEYLTSGQVGAITASNAYTTSSYTLKSITGMLCGISPMVANFNEEYKNHVYQPYIPHVLDTLSSQTTSPGKTEDFTTWPWQSTWMQSVTNAFDNQVPLNRVLGFNGTISRETLVDPTSPHYPPKSEDINYFGMRETELKPYLHDALTFAEKNQERLFLTHLTSTTHHPWGLPKDYSYQQFMGTTGYGTSRKINRYLNTLGLVDDWLADILDVLNETGVGNETLVILTGDHGISLPDDGGVCYENPHVGNMHVPLMFHHPSLPFIEIDSAVSAIQILPTLLDLLISSSSLNEAASQAASDLLPLYEGQSLLRPQRHFTEEGYRSWQFTVIQAGGSQLAMRSTTTSYRLAVPLAEGVEWRFTDLETDPHELEAVMEFDFHDLVANTELKYGKDAAEWVGEAAHVAKWWVKRNRRLWSWGTNVT